MSSSTIRRIIAGVLLAAPLAVGAAINVDIASTWSPQEESSGAPAAHIDPNLLVDVRRAAGEASSQAGLLKIGTDELVKGTGELSEGAGTLGDGTKAAQQGAQELADGMVQLQAATGQLGTGATEMADGIDNAMNQIVALEAVRGQILTSLDNAAKELETARDYRSREMLKELQGFRTQVETFEIDANAMGDLTKLRDGSRELANQLHTPGYGFHDGIYTATKGAKELSQGLNELAGGVDAALAGVDKLEDGANQLQLMAQKNQQKIGEVNRAIPVAQAGTPEAEEQGITRTFAPMYAFLLAAGIMLAANTLSRSTGRIVLGVSAVALMILAGVLMLVIGNGITAAAAVVAGLVAGLIVVVAASGSILLQRLLGATWGQVAAIVGSAAQVGIVGWVWNQASTSQIGGALELLGNLMPLHYPTLAFAALGNAGNGQALGLSIGVLGLLAVAAGVALKLVQVGRPKAEDAQTGITA